MNKAARYVVLVVLCLITGCNPTSPIPQPGVAVPLDATATPLPEPTSTPERVIVTLAYNRSLQTSFGPGPAPIEVIRQAVARKHPNIEVQLNLLPDSVNAHRDALAVWITAENPTIDIYGMDEPWVLEFGQAGWSEPLNEYLPTMEEHFVPSGLRLFTYQGQRIGVPFWGTIGGLFYRTDLLAEYGFEPPETYEDLVNIAEIITTDQPALTGFVWPGAREEELVEAWLEFFHGFGGTYFDETGRCTMNSPQGVRAVEFMVRLIEEGISPRETTAWTSEEARTRFLIGEAIFLRHNHDIMDWMDDPERSAVVGNWGFMPNPAQPQGTHTGASASFAFAINPHTDVMPEAIAVMRLIASEEVQKGFAIAWGPVQYYKGLYDDPDIRKSTPSADLIKPLLNTAVSQPSGTNYAQLSDILQDELHSALTRLKPVETALNDACRRIDALP